MSEGGKGALAPNAAAPANSWQRHATLLLVGTDVAAKRALAEELFKLPDIAVQVRSTAKLPLPPAAEGKPRPRVDHVVLLADTLTRASWRQVVDSAQALDPIMLSNRTTLVITGVRSESAVSPEELDEFTELYDLTPIYANPKDIDGCRLLCKRLKLPLEVAAGYHTAITPTVLNSTDYDRVYTTAYEELDEEGDSVMSPDASAAPSSA